MNLSDIVHRAPPVPWEAGGNLPWDDPSFSERMLREHLDQGHDLASRQFEKVDAHVEWIQAELLGDSPARVLDIACGPGLYTSRLAKLGHECVGVDFSPASIAYATDFAQNEKLRATYVQADARDGLPDGLFDLAMMVWGQFNVFSRADAERLLSRIHARLSHGGTLLLEPQTEEQVRSAGSARPTWSTARTGLFSERPHLLLEESAWDEDSRTATSRFYIVDAATGRVTHHALSSVAYDEAALRSMLGAAGFQDIRRVGSLTGEEEEPQAHTMVFVARK